MAATNPVDPLRCALRELLENIESPPEPNCSCHLHPPCADCVNHSGLRAAIAQAERALEETEPGVPVVHVTRTGIGFGPNCWFSHEQITSRSAAEINAGASIILRAYRDFVAASLEEPAEILAP